MAASSEHFVARAGGQDGHASLKRMSTADVSVRERLDTARAEGQRFRLRVQLPLVALGMLINVTVMAVGVVMIAHMLTGSARSDAVTVVYYVLLLPGPLAAIFILFALLPTDTGVILKLAYGGAFSGCLMFSAISAWQAVLDAIEMSRPRRAGAGSCVHWQLGEMPCWFAAFPLAWHLMCTLFPLYDGKQIAQLVSAIGRGGGGARVEPVPRILGRTLVTVGLVQLFGLLASAIVGVYRFEPHHPQRGFWLVFCALTAELLLVGPLLVHGGLRQRMQTWLASRGEAISAAAGVAGLLGNHAPEAVQAKAAEIFRSVTLDRLTLADMRESTPNPALYTRSEPATFARVDAFVSHRHAPRAARASVRARTHAAVPRRPELSTQQPARGGGGASGPRAAPCTCSWRDDADAKWTELSEWCAAFQRRAGRQPRLWIDKVCLDQTQIEDNLMCLPVFLAGCNQLLILAGSTYLSRLWW